MQKGILILNNFLTAKHENLTAEVAEYTQRAQRYSMILKKDFGLNDKNLAIYFIANDTQDYSKV